MFNAYKEKIMANEENKTTQNQAVVTAIQYNEGTIIAMANGDKFSRDVKRTFAIEDPSTNYRVNIKWELALEIAEIAEKSGTISIRIRNGYPAEGKRAAGAGIAGKFEKDGKFYNCTFLESEMGEPFDVKKVQRRTFIKLNAEHLGSIFTFLRYDKIAVDAKAEVMKLERSTLDLG